MKIAFVIFAVSAVLLGFFIYQMTGAGSFKRMAKISGVYSICKPDKYDVVCFLDADSKDGGMFCLPLSTVGGSCK